MLSIFKRRNGDAFEQRQKLMDVWKTIRRIVDRSVQNRSVIEDELRTQSRNVRCVPALVVPWHDDEPQANLASFAITHDFSDQGVCLLVQEAPASETLLCGFFDQSPMFLLGEVRRCIPFGGGYSQVGVEFHELVPASDLPTLIPFARQLDVTAVV